MNNLDLFLQLLKNVGATDSERSMALYTDTISQLAIWVQRLENQQLLDKQDIIEKMDKLENKIDETLTKLNSNMEKVSLILNGYNEKDNENGLINKVSSIETGVKKLNYFKIQIVTGVAVVNCVAVYLLNLLLK